MKSLESVLTDDEAGFVRLVFNNPGAKLNGGEAFGEDGESLWTRPENIGLIECIGSYKWKPTNMLAAEIRIVEPTLEA